MTLGLLRTRVTCIRELRKNTRGWNAYAFARHAPRMNAHGIAIQQTAERIAVGLTPLTDSRSRVRARAHQ